MGILFNSELQTMQCYFINPQGAIWLWINKKAPLLDDHKRYIETYHILISCDKVSPCLHVFSLQLLRMLQHFIDPDKNQMIYGYSSWLWSQRLFYEEKNYENASLYKSAQCTKTHLSLLLHVDISNHLWLMHSVL